MKLLCIVLIISVLICFGILVRYFLKHRDEETILDRIYYDLYSIPYAHPEIRELDLTSTTETSNTVHKHNVFLNISSYRTARTAEAYNYCLYKAAHELAHVKCLSIGHTDEFQTIFNKILAELEKNKKYSEALRHQYELKKYGETY